MSKVIGIVRNDFKLKDGTQITGVNVFLSDPIDPAKGKGVMTDKVYLSDHKISNNHIDLDAIYGKNVCPRYNRFGKIEDLEVVN